MGHGWPGITCRLVRCGAVSGGLCLIVACATGGGDRLAVTSEDWSYEALSGRRFRTEHFELFSTLRDSEFEEAIPAFLEAVHRQCQRTLRSPNSTADRAIVYVFGTRQEWAYFSRRRFPTRYDAYSRIWRGGFTEGDTSVSFYTDRDTTLATLAHEVWHLYVGSRFDAPMPAWLNEGLACSHETIRTAGKQTIFTPKRNAHRINSLCEAVHRDTLLSIEQLVATDAGEILGLDQGRLTQTYYAQAWALVTFLRHGAGGCFAARFDQLLKDVANGRFRIRVSAARLGTTTATGTDGSTPHTDPVFEAYFGCSPASLASDYYDHVVRLCGF